MLKASLDSIKVSTRIVGRIESDSVKDSFGILLYRIFGLASWKIFLGRIFGISIKDSEPSLDQDFLVDDWLLCSMILLTCPGI